MDYFVWGCGRMDSFDFEKLYKVGDNLKDFSKEEEYQRSAVTRYYYSIFHSVKKYYEKSFRKVLPSKNGHSILIESLEKSAFENERELGEKLRYLRNNRNHADYIARKVTKEKAKESKKIADEILALLDHHINHPLRLTK